MAKEAPKRRQAAYAKPRDSHRNILLQVQDKRSIRAPFLRTFYSIKVQTDARPESIAIYMLYTQLDEISDCRRCWMKDTR